MTFFIVYTDLLFIINFMMDSLLLILVRYILKQPTTFLRIAVSATAGSLWICIVIQLPIYRLWPDMILSYFLISALMLTVAFRIRQVRILMKNLTAFYAAAAFIGGIFQSLHNLTQKYHLFSTNAKAYGRGWSILLFVAMGSLAFIIAAKIIYTMQKRRQSQSHICEICIDFGGYHMRTRALLDTGNHLYEPIQHKPVSIVEASVLQEYLENDMQWHAFFSELKTGRVTEALPGFRVIPYQSVGHPNGVMYAVTADRLIIVHQDKVFEHAHAVIGICQEQISGKNGYHAILHPDLILDAAS